MTTTTFPGSPVHPASPARAPAARDPRAAVGDLLVLYEDEIRDASRRCTRTAADAEDLAQDVRVRALGFAHLFELGTNFPAWVRTLTRNLAINRGRAAAKRPRPESTFGETCSIDATPARPAICAPVASAALAASAESAASAALAAVRDDVSDPVVAAVEELPDVYRDVLVLWSLGEHTYQEIADLVGCPVGTVMSRLHRARRLVRARLAGDVDERRLHVGR